MADGVDNAGVAAAADDHQPFVFEVDDRTLIVVSERIGPIGTTELYAGHYMDDRDLKSLRVIYAWPRRPNEPGGTGASRSWLLLEVFVKVIEVHEDGDVVPAGVFRTARGTTSTVRRCRIVPISSPVGTIHSGLSSSPKLGPPPICALTY